jgi:hypothetical protein
MLDQAGAVKGVSLGCGKWIGGVFTYKDRHSGSLCVAIIGGNSHRALKFAGPCQ